MKNTDYLSENIRWNETDDPEYPFRAVHHGKLLVLRMNDFPDEPLYTLIVNDKEVIDLDDFPVNWSIAELAYNISAAD